jgi:hypothetical protein
VPSGNNIYKLFLLRVERYLLHERNRRRPLEEENRPTGGFLEMEAGLRQQQAGFLGVNAFKDVKEDEQRGV